MKYNKVIYITILIISALIAYTIGFDSFSKKNESRTNALTTRDNSALTSETLIDKPPAAQPDYSFNLRAAGISAQMPAYCIYNLSIYGDIAKISKIHECILGFKVSKILHINTTKNTLLLNEIGNEIYCFNESNNKIESRVISFSPAANDITTAKPITTDDFTNGVKINYTSTPAATPEDIITALAKTKDEKLMAAALKKSGTIQIFLAHNFEHILSITDKSAGLNSIQSIDFDAKNNLYITTSDKSLNLTTLYLCRANLSYSKLEKINWFSLAADSSLFDPVNELFIYYNRNSGTIFKIDCRNAQSGIIMTNPPQISEELPPAESFNPSASQLFKLSNSCALVRNDSKLIKIFNPITGQITQEVKLNAAAGLEITGGTDEKYASITSSDDGIISLIDRAAPQLINAGRLEGLNVINCIEN